MLFFSNAIKKRKNTNFRDLLLFIKFAAFKKYYNCVHDFL